MPHCRPRTWVCCEEKICDPGFVTDYEVYYACYTTYVFCRMNWRVVRPGRLKMLYFYGVRRRPKGRHDN